MTLTESILNCSGVTQKCFICWENFSSNEVKKLESGHQYILSPSSNKPTSKQLNEQLPVILLLRKVLGLQKNILAEFIEGFGNPGSWNLRLCSPCTRLFREAKFLYRRLIKSQGDFEELAKEIRGVVLFSSKTVEYDDGDKLGETKRTEKIQTRFKNNTKNPLTSSSRANSKTNDGNDSTSCVLQKLRRKFFEESEANLLEFHDPRTFHTSQVSRNEKDLNSLASNSISNHISESEEDENGRLFKKSSNTSQKKKKQVEVKTPLSSSSSNPGDDSNENMDEIEDSTTSSPENDYADFSDSQIDPSVAKVKSEHFYGDDFIEPNNIYADFDSDQVPDPLSTNEPLETNKTESSSVVFEDEEYHEQTDEGGDSGTNSSDEDYSEKESKKRQKVRKRRNKKSVTAPVPYTLNPKPGSRREMFHRMMAKSMEKVPEKIHLELVPDSKGRFKCTETECSESFARKFDCCTHILKEHYEDPMPYHCHVCPGKRFHLEMYFRRHMNRFHQGARCPLDEDYQPELHSSNILTKKMKLSQAREKVGKKIFPELPEEILAEFKGNPSKQLQCGQCSKLFSSKLSRDAHEKRMHQGIKHSYSCDLCPRKFAKRIMLLKHLTMSHFSGQHACNQCGLTLADKISLDGHVRRVHMGDDKPFKCTSKDCFKRFKKKVIMYLHMKKCHGISVPPAGKKITAKMVAIPKVDPRQAGNDSNDSGDDEKNTLISGSDQFICPICDKPFNDKQTLDNHVANHEITLPFICTYCGKRFKENNSLTHHEKQVHYKELGIQPPFMCDKCGKILNSPRSLKHHKLIMHQNAAKYKCPHCDFGCMYEVQIQGHIRARHLKVKDALCPICSQTFSQNWELTRHMRLHSGEKPYKCVHCGKEFSDKPTYNRHVEAHSGRIHKCPVESCSGQYKTRHAFRIHLKQHRKKGVMVEVPSFRVGRDPIGSDHIDSQPSQEDVVSIELGKNPIEGSAKAGDGESANVMKHVESVPEESCQ